MNTKTQTICVALLSALPLTGCSDGVANEPTLQTSQVTSPLYVDSEEIWPSPTIPVCWIPSGWETEKGWVRQAVQETWEKETGVRFTGWRQCPEFDYSDPEDNPQELRIGIADENPRTGGLGWQLAFSPTGMILNFTFKEWKPDCQPRKSFCIKAIAVHEFGHALGIAHEQNRPDTPATCNDRQGSDGDSLVGAWDLMSIMNYCNPSWNADGKLSALDIDGVRKYYGRPVFHVAGVDGGGKLWHSWGITGGFKHLFEDVEHFQKAGEIGTVVDVDLAYMFMSLHLVATNSAGQVMHTMRNEDGTWKTFAPVASGTFSRVGAAGMPDLADSNFGEQLHVCAVKTDGTLWHNIRRKDATWQGFGSVTNAVGTNPGTFVDVDCARVNDELALLALRNDGKLFMTRRARSGSWSAFVDVKQFATDPGFISDVSVSELGDGSSVVVSTTGGQQWSATRSRQGVWTPFSAINVVDTKNTGTAVYKNELTVLGQSNGVMKQITQRSNAIWDTTAKDIGTKLGVTNFARVSIASGGNRQFNELSRANLPATIYNSGSLEQRFLSGDFDGDGRLDMFQTYRGWGSIPVCTSTGSTWSCQNPGATIHNSGSRFQQFLPADVDGDGRTDILQTFNGWNSIPTCFSTGSGWNCSNLSATVEHGGSSRERFFAGDFTADHKTDVVQVDPARTDSIMLCASTGTSWSCSRMPATIYDSGSAEQQVLTGDVNGDGRMDLVQTYRGWHSLPTCLSFGTSFSCTNPGATIFDSGSTEQRFAAGDFNGDGRTDVIQTFRGWSSIPVCFSTGTGWDCENRPADVLNSGDIESFVVADVNRDGKSDVVAYSRNWASYQVCYAGDRSWNCDSMATDAYDSGSNEQVLFVDQFNGRQGDMIRAYRGWGSYPTDTNPLY